VLVPLSPATIPPLPPKAPTSTNHYFTISPSPQPAFALSLSFSFVNCIILPVPSPVGKPNHQISINELIPYSLDPPIQSTSTHTEDLQSIFFFFFGNLSKAVPFGPTRAE
jgi:hypothetical protein